MYSNNNSGKGQKPVHNGYKLKLKERKWEDHIGYNKCTFDFNNRKSLKNKSSNELKAIFGDSSLIR